MAGYTRHAPRYGRLFQTQAVALAIFSLPLLAILPSFGWGQTLSYDDTWAAIDACVEAGDRAGAIDLLDGMTVRYPQEFAVHLQLGWLQFQEGHYGAAAVAYEQAISLSPHSDDAAVGLAWSQYYLGLRSKARQRFQEVLARSPDHRSAQEGLMLSRVMHRFGLGAVGIVQLYDGHPTRESALGVGVNAGALFWEALLLTANYRYASYTASIGTDSGDIAYDFGQHDIGLSAGFVTRRVGLTGHYGYADGGGSTAHEVHYAGTMARLTTWGDLTLEANGSWYDDGEVYRLAAAYRLPLASWVDVTVGGGYQHADGEHFGNGTASASLRFGKWTLAAGGKYGVERRPLYLAPAVVYNSDDDHRLGAHASGGYAFDNGLRLDIGYEWLALTTDVGDGEVDSTMHLFTASFGWSGGLSAD